MVAACGEDDFVIVGAAHQVVVFNQLFVFAGERIFGHSQTGLHELHQLKVRLQKASCAAAFDHATVLVAEGVLELGDVLGEHPQPQA